MIDKVPGTWALSTRICQSYFVHTEFSQAKQNKAKEKQLFVPLLVEIKLYGNSGRMPPAFQMCSDNIKVTMQICNLSPELSLHCLKE